MSRILTALLLWLALTTQTLAVQNLLVVYPDIEHGSSTLIVSSTGNAVLVDNSLGDRVFRPRWPWGGCLVLCRKGEPWSTSDPLTTTASAYIRSLDGDASILPRTTPFDKDRRNNALFELSLRPLMKTPRIPVLDQPFSRQTPPLTPCHDAFFIF